MRQRPWLSLTYCKQTQALLSRMALWRQPETIHNDNLLKRVCCDAISLWKTEAFLLFVILALVRCFTQFPLQIGQDFHNAMTLSVQQEAMTAKICATDFYDKWIGILGMLINFSPFFFGGRKELHNKIWVNCEFKTPCVSSVQLNHSHFRSRNLTFRLSRKLAFLTPSAPCFTSQTTSQFSQSRNEQPCAKIKKKDVEWNLYSYWTSKTFVILLLIECVAAWCSCTQQTRIARLKAFTADPGMLFCLH